MKKNTDPLIANVRSRTYNVQLFSLYAWVYNELCDHCLSTGKGCERVWHCRFPVWGHKVRRHPNFQGPVHVSLTFRQGEGGHMSCYQAMICDETKEIIPLSDTHVRKAILARYEDALEEADDNPLGLELEEGFRTRSLKGARNQVDKILRWLEDNG